MLLRSLEYERPTSTQAAVEALRSSRRARALAGGQSLINVLKHRLAECDLLVDISRLEELRSIDVAVDGSVRIGAAVTYDELDNSASLRGAHPKLAEVAGGIADQQVRCRGTIGGNACYSDPASNFPPLLVALDAKMEILGADGLRSVSAEEFFHGPFDTAVRPGELLIAIHVPARGELGVGYSTVTVADEDSWALARACAALKVNGTISGARVVVSALAGAPVRLPELEERLSGLEASPEAIREACANLGAGLAAVSDVHASAEYRREMAAVVVRRAIVEATER
ncbi:MAG TPA: xanthine dehydrogenase family protein subunit M [Solirubrobacteraceae bacterium]|nr:xanthine dehydrogenase family protein subunit M [Solirubrobacteraceae bacterium]